MNEVLTSLPWQDILSYVWTVILIPILTYIGTQINEWAKSKKIDKYTNILISTAETVVKELYQTIVNDIKGTDEWTEEKKAEILKIAKSKIIRCLTDTGYKILKNANTDFDTWLNAIIESKIWEIKNKYTEFKTAFPS